MATNATITGYNSTQDAFLAADAEGSVFFLDFSDVETWYKKAVARREAEEEQFARQFK